jgi:hypothetical protein
MIVDRYTKAVLTVIAGCLLWICAMGVAPRIEARQSTMDLAGAAQPVVIVGTGTLDRMGKVAVNFAPGAARTDPTLAVQLPYTSAKPLPVSLPYTTSNPMPSQLFYTSTAPLPVEISAVRKPADWEPIRVRVEPAPTSLRPGGGR